MMKKIVLVILFSLFITILASCQSKDDDVTLSMDFNVQVTFGSIHITIDDITDADEALLSFNEFYDRIDHTRSGLTFYSSEDQVDAIFYAFSELMTLTDVDFDEQAGTIILQGDIELNSGSFASQGSFKDFEVFVHDRASINVVSSDASWEKTKAVAIPYLTINAQSVSHNTVITLNANEAYGTGDLAFLPTFDLTTLNSVDMLPAVLSNYVNAKNNAVDVALFEGNAIKSWGVWVQDYSVGAQGITGIEITYENNTFVVSASKDATFLEAALTLYFMEPSIGTIRYINLRFLGEEGSNIVTVAPITNSGNETTITSDDYLITSGDNLSYDNNLITHNDYLITNDMIVGQFLEGLEKENDYQAWIVTSLNNRPLSASVFGTAESKDFEVDTLNDGDILSVLSADWEVIRYYTINVIDMSEYLAAINAATDETSLALSLSETELNLEIDSDNLDFYFKAYQNAGYLEENSFEFYLGVKAFVEAVNQSIYEAQTLLVDINAATNETELIDALLELDNLTQVDASLSEVYFTAYEQAGYLIEEFTAVEAVQGFVDEVNAYMAVRIALLNLVNSADDALSLYDALTDTELLIGINSIYKPVYYQAYLNAGYDNGETFDAIEAVQGFIDGVNTEMDATMATLEDVNEAIDAAYLMTALKDTVLTLTNVSDDNELDYWVAYESAGYDVDEVFISIEGVQAFVSAVNSEVNDRLALLSDVNNATSSTTLLSALQSTTLNLDNVLSGNETAYWQAYLAEGFDTKHFRYIEVVQSFVNAVNDTVQNGGDTETDLTDLNNASNENALLSALKALDLTNVLDSNKTNYWMAYQHSGYASSETFDSIQEAQGFVNGVNSH